ncbi:MAG: transglycosylase domain-containing protein, partial [Candidatus Eisenbacteria bacterium]|nr:transglycosylase domain-containing protein [Candidatus Eisenbacteria bacterium]
MNIAPRKKAFEFSLHGWSRPRLLPLRFQRPPDWLIATAVAGAVVTVFVVREAKESTLQSGLLSRIARQLTYRVEPGPGDAILFPSEGPFDISRGYAAIPRITERLSGSGYRVIAQARMSERMQSLARHGVPPVYDEKTQAGLTILDRQGKRLYEVSSPRRAYSDFDSIPPLVVKSLLFVENRELLEKDRPRLNPGVEWDRLVRAAFEFALNRVGLDREQPGGCLLYTSPSPRDSA